VMKLRRIALLAMLLSTLAIFFACDVSNNEAAHTGRDDYGGADNDDGDTDDDEGSDDDSDVTFNPISINLAMETTVAEGAIQTDRLHNPFNVMEIEQSNQVFALDWRDYLRFIDLAADHSRPISHQRLWQQFAKIEQGLVQVHDPEQEKELQNNETLVSLISEAMNLNFLLDGIEERELIVTTIRRTTTEFYYEREMVFSDPYVGDFQGILLTPKTEGPHPAVIAIHGHHDDASTFIHYNGGADFPRVGIALLALSMRADEADEIESLVSESLLEAGFSFMALRIYETALALKYLQYRPEYDYRHIGLIGHSGGSVAGNLTAHILPGVRAYVSDLQSTYFNIIPDQVIIDETTPLLFPYHNAINFLESYPIPVKFVPYGFIDGILETLEFFDKELRDD